MKSLLIFLFTISSATIIYFNIKDKDNLSWDSINNSLREDFPSISSISVEELDLLIKKKVKLILLDVRTKKEFETSHIYGAINIEDPEDIVLRNIASDTKIIAYCSVGYRSAIFIDKLTDHGYTNLYNLKGSIFEWVNKGYPVYRGQEITTKIHPYNKYWGQLLEKK